MPENLEDKNWDVIIVGTGMGGATMGYALAKAGRKVLFCEKGKSHINGAESIRGDYAEKYFSHADSSSLKQDEVLARAGRWFDPIEDVSSGRVTSFVPLIGCGTGGSSALYGMALERFFPSDFIPKRFHPEAHDASLPEQWPISYEELVPYYEEAEKLYRVRGTADELRGEETKDHFIPPPTMTPGSAELHDFLVSKGLHPYRIPLGCEFSPGCECCQSYLCDKDCKNDSARICLSPAISAFGAYLLDKCEVLRLEATRNEITGVVCNRRGREIVLRGKVIVLAAGALETPKILLNSASPEWQNGLANDSGLVGKNLMRHYIDLYALIPKTRGDFSVSLKEIAVNDYYAQADHKFGTLQSFGSMPPPEIIVKTMEQDIRKSAFPLASPLFRLVRPIVTKLLAKIFNRRIILATIIEDLPYSDNMVTVSETRDQRGRKRLVLNYTIRDHDRRRIERFRMKISDLLHPYSVMLIRQAENNQRIAHACGTCRFGGDPQQSVLDKYNRAHGISNLFVIDASFFPSSGGTNPALTIAANALRVADYLLKESPAK